MTSQYSIIQYVPNPIADERINIGVVVFNEQVMKERSPAFPIGILLLSPKETSPSYNKLHKFYLHTSEMFKEQGATVLEETQLEPWAESLVDTILTSA